VPIRAEQDWQSPGRQGINVVVASADPLQGMKLAQITTATIREYQKHRGSGPAARRACRAFARTISGERPFGTWSATAVPRSVAMALVGHQTEEVYRRYAIVDEAMIREAAVKMNRGATTRRTTAQSTAQSNAGMADT
jgi:hypothetical protein